MNLVIVDLPYHGSLYAAGVGTAPAAWRAAGLAESLAPFVERAVWVSLPALELSGDEQEKQVAIGRRLADTVRVVRSAGVLPLVLGGDPLLAALGTVAGLQQTGLRPGLVWFGSGADLFSSPPAQEGVLEALTGPGRLGAVIGLTHPVTGWHVLLAGVRGLDMDQDASLEDLDATVWSAKDLQLAGADELGRDMAHWPPVYLHLDLNVLDPEQMPAASQSSPAGLAIETLLAGVEHIAAAVRVAALGVTGMNPQRDQDDRGLVASMHVIAEAVRILSI